MRAIFAVEHSENHHGSADKFAMVRSIARDVQDICEARTQRCVHVLESLEVLRPQVDAPDSRGTPPSHDRTLPLRPKRRAPRNSLKRFD